MKVKFYILLSGVLISAIFGISVQAMTSSTAKNEFYYNLIVNNIEQNNAKASVDLLRQALKQGFDVNYLGEVRSDTKETLLSKAVKSGDIDLVRTLLNAGANPNIEYNYEGVRRMPLHIAVLDRKNLTIVQELIKAGADVNAKDEENYTPLMRAIEFYNIPAVQTLLNVLDVDLTAKDNSGKTALDMVKDLPYHKRKEKQALLKLLTPYYTTLKSKSIEAVKKYRGQQIPEEQIKKQLPEELQEALR